MPYGVPCTTCGHQVDVHYDAIEDMVTDGTDTYIGIWFRFKNLEPAGGCTADFVTCSMVEYQAPWIATHDLAPDLLGRPVEYGQTWSSLELTYNAGTPCKYTCAPITGGGQNSVSQWAFDFGCKEMHIPPGQTMEAFDKWYHLSAPQPQALLLSSGVEDVGDPRDPTTIQLSQSPPNDDDHSITTWNATTMYTDFLMACTLDPSCNFEAQPNIEYGQDITNSPCNPVSGEAHNTWNGFEHLSLASPTSGGLFGTVTFPTGNEFTMSTMSTYPVQFRGVIGGAPIGTKISIYAPIDTMGGMAVMDSGSIITTSDTFGFQFNFLIPPMDPGMKFKIEIPSGSSNIGNGREIRAAGDIYASATSSLYDSGAFMYGQRSTWVLDTTPPQISNFALNQLDSNKLEIRLTGIEDTTMITKGYVKYSVNGGPTKLFVLQYEDMAAVGDTTSFLDTLVTDVAHPKILLRGFVGNQVGLLDSTTIDTCQLKIESSSVAEEQNGTLRVNYLFVDHNDKTMTIDFQTDGGSVTFDLVSEEGKSIRLPVKRLFNSGEQRVVQSISNEPSGAYFLIIRSNTQTVIEKIIL